MGGRAATRATSGPPTSGAASRSTTTNADPGGGLYTGALLTGIDSLGGFLSGLAVQPQWIVTTNMMVTIAQLAHVGPLRLHGRVLRRGRNQVVSALDIFDEGDGR